MAQSPSRDDYAFLLGKKLIEISLGGTRAELRFDHGIRIEIDGDIEHRLHTDTLGRAAPVKEPLPSLSHLVGMTVRQVGVERDSLLLAFDDGHEVRLFKAVGRPDFGIVSP